MRAARGIRRTPGLVLTLAALAVGMAATGGPAGAAGRATAAVTIRHCSSNPLLLAGGNVSCATARTVVAGLKGVKPTGLNHRVHVDGFGCSVQKFGATCWRNLYKPTAYSVNDLVWAHH